jgi:hypothetical protein
MCASEEIYDIQMQQIYQRQQLDRNQLFQRLALIIDPVEVPSRARLKDISNHWYDYQE